CIGVVHVCLLLFFASRRRHTRSKRDWSSDVCSSDLNHANDLCQYRRFSDSRCPKIQSSILIDRPSYHLIAHLFFDRNGFTCNHRSEERREGKECKKRWTREH